MSKKCIIKSCKNEITGIRLQRGYETCSNPGCAYINNLNKMTAYRAEKLGRPTGVCSTKNCGRNFVHVLHDRGKCTQCRRGLSPQAGMPPGRLPPQPRNNYDQSSAGVSYCDTRSKICIRNGVACADYSGCTDTLENNKNCSQFKYNTNGGVNCWVKPKPKPVAGLTTCALSSLEGLYCE